MPLQEDYFLCLYCIFLYLFEPMITHTYTRHMKTKRQRNTEREAGAGAKRTFASAKVLELVFELNKYIV